MENDEVWLTGPLNDSIGITYNSMFYGPEDTRVRIFMEFENQVLQKYIGFVSVVSKIARRRGNSSSPSVIELDICRRYTKVEFDIVERLKHKELKAHYYVALGGSASDDVS